MHSIMASLTKKLESIHILGLRKAHQADYSIIVELSYGDSLGEVPRKFFKELSETKVKVAWKKDRKFYINEFTEIPSEANGMYLEHPKGDNPTYYEGTFCYIDIPSVKKDKMLGEDMEVRTLIER